MKYSMLVLLLIVAAISLVLVGCGKSGTTASGSKTGSATAGTATAAAPDPAAFKAYREEHKVGMQLQEKVRQIAKLETDGKAKLTQEQAKKILDLLTPLRATQDLDEDTAKDIILKFPELTKDQQAELATLAPKRGQGGANGGAVQGGGGGTGDAGAGAGGGRGQGGARAGGGGGNRPPMDLEHFNPFYQKKDAPADDKRAHAFDAFFTGLESKAKG